MKNTKKSSKKSAGFLMYKLVDNTPFYFLVHPAGPFFSGKELGSWSIPKGEIEGNDDALETAKREFIEETGITPVEPFFDLGSIKQKSGKIVCCWAFQGDFDGKLNCTSFVELEWPKNSGKIIKFPEVDKAQLFSKEEAKKYINVMQFELIERFEKLLKL
jgi:predicted NUDIX family NTP pyrophosphohydrolase